MNIQDRFKLIKHMLHELETPSRSLTSWEEGFIASVSDNFERRGDLSEKQFETLEKIYAEKTD